MSHVQDVQRAVLRSNLAAPGRQLVMALCILADYETGVIPERFTPSITELCEMTALGRSTVTEHLNILEENKWCERDRPSDYEARVLKRKTRYKVRIGLGVRLGLVRQADQPNIDEPDISSSDLDRQADQPSPASGPTKADETDMSESVLVQEADQASPPGGREVPTKNPPKSKTYLSAETSKPAEESKPPTRGTRIPDDFWPTPSMISWAREKTPNVGLAETEAFVDWAKSTSKGVAVKLDWAAAWRNWMRREQKKVDERAARAASTPSSGRANIPPSAPEKVPIAEQCRDHPGRRAAGCGLCRAANLGATKQSDRKAS